MTQIKAIRQHLDHLMIQTKQYPNNREVALAYTNTQRASMWLGQVLKELSEPNPYPNSTDTSNEKIEPRADQSFESPAMFEGMPNESNTIKAKWFRNEIETIIKELTHHVFSGDEAQHARNLAMDALKEAKMWWGWELNNIYNQPQTKAAE